MSVLMTISTSIISAMILIWVTGCKIFFNNHKHLLTVYYLKDSVAQYMSYLIASSFGLTSYLLLWILLLYFTFIFTRSII